MEKQLTMFEMVQEFHAAFNKIKDPKVPTEQSDDVKALRVKLMEEELEEVMHELGYVMDVDGFYSPYDKNRYVHEFNVVKLAKELADLLYVVLGTAAAYGIPIDEVYREVHRSNMSKLGADGKPVYREDGKVLKGPNYTPADVEEVLRKYGK